jgi:hypothetical protein
VFWKALSKAGHDIAHQIRHFLNMPSKLPENHFPISKCISRPHA